ncbi:MAG TPA: hypothetical protein VNO54_23620 [Streptosporangiaceae bacterium]|nr:hypothetical protein [Streptosporangiaceae bacterium]
MAADLAYEKHRTTSLRQQLKDTGEERDSWKWAATKTITSHDDLVITRTRERDQARRLLRTAETQLGEAHQQITVRTRKQVAYSNQAVGNMRRLARALNACARYRAELAEQKHVIDRLTDQLLDAFDYAPGDRQRLGLPAQEVTS